jgi:hypothetical protein
MSAIRQKPDHSSEEALVPMAIMELVGPVPHHHIVVRMRAHISIDGEVDFTMEKSDSGCNLIIPEHATKVDSLRVVGPDVSIPSCHKDSPSQISLWGNGSSASTTEGTSARSK